jgi:hypothetical protein
VTDESKPPPELGVHGRRLWRQIAREVAQDGAELDSRERLWLLSAAKLSDQLAIIEQALVDQPSLVVPGYSGQPTAHPLLNEVRQYHGLISQTLGRLRLDPPESTGVLGVVGAANKARAAADTRWRPGSRA